MALKNKVHAFYNKFLERLAPPKHTRQNLSQDNPESLNEEAAELICEYKMPHGKIELYDNLKILVHRYYSEQRSEDGIQTLFFQNEIEAKMEFQRQIGMLKEYIHFCKSPIRKNYFKAIHEPESAQHDMYFYLSSKGT